ncbi:MAG TPA: SRPBCC domain-containing protein, partial [Rudaea sp.]
PRRLVIRWRHQRQPELKAEGDSFCTMELEPEAGAVKLSITHTVDREASKLIQAVSGGWPKVISNLKSLMETGSIALQEPYPAQKRA